MTDGDRIVSHTENPLCFSNAIIRQYLSFVEHAQGKGSLTEIRRLLTTRGIALESDELWHDAVTHDLFLTALGECFADQPDFAYQVAKAAFVEQKYQIFTSMIGLLINPKTLFRKLPEAVTRMNHYNTYSISGGSAHFAIGQVELTQEYGDAGKIRLNSYLCDACRGSIEGSLEYFGYNLIEIKELKCVKKGDHLCKYHITWVKRPRIHLVFLFVLLGLSTYLFVEMIPLNFSLIKIGLTILIPTTALLGLNYFNTRKKMVEVFEYQQSLYQNQKEISEQIAKLNSKILRYQCKVAEALELASVGETSVRFLQEASIVIKLLKYYSSELHNKITDGFSEPEKILTYSHAIELATKKVESILESFGSRKVPAKEETGPS